LIGALVSYSNRQGEGGMRIADFGFRISDFGMRISDLGTLL